MAKKKIGSLGQTDDLRRQAEEKTSSLETQELEALSPEETRQTLHELLVHQIELTMQNEELRRTQEELDAAQARYFDLYDRAPVGYFTLSDEGLILEANLTASSLLDVARSALVKKSLNRFIFREDQDIYYHYCQQLFKTGATQVCELRLVRKDGSLFWARLESVVAQDSESGYVLCYTAISDITERKQAEEKLFETTEYLEKLIKYANAPIMVWDTSLSITRFNKAFENLSGYKASEVIGKKIDILFSKNKIESALEHIQKTSSGERWKAVEIEIKRKDGEPRIVLWNSANILDTKRNNIIATIAQGQDITKRKQAELLILIQRDLALAISFSHQLDEALLQCLDTMLQLSEMDCGRIYLIDQASGDLNLICHKNLSPAFIKSVSHYQADSTYARLVLQGKPLFTRYSEFDLPLDEVRKAEKLRALAVLPLIFENQVIGCLNLASRKLEEVSELNREVLKTAATLLGEGITRLKIEEELKLSYQKLQKAIKSTIQAIALILEKRDPYTAGHQKRMTKLACAIAEEISLPKDKIEGLYIAGVIHDIGKINVPTEILSKPGRLSEIELSLIQTHPQVGSDILKEMELPGEVSAIVLQHHERMDGSGYPSGLSGEVILLEARILAVADVVEAMASHRPYRPALGLDKALEEITQNRGILYDPEVVDTCLKLFKKKGFKFE
jgi:PAS domain S-box-containing protein